MAQTPNYDESKVPEFELSELLVLQNGQAFSDIKTWESQGRPEILQLFEEEVYGKLPNSETNTVFEEKESSTDALNGLAIRKQIQGTISTQKGESTFDILMYLPKSSEKAAPVFLALNFFGNHSIHVDPNIMMSEKWMMESEKLGIVEHKATEASRGVRSNRWDIEALLKRGYALATIYYGDFDPDFHDEFQNGLHPLFDAPKSKDWGAIGAWAYGLHRAMDYLSTDPDIDATKVILMGHSRLGKAALYAGATDERFSIVISNNSGCGGAALSKRKFGETVQVINDRFPHWFCENFKKYNNQEENLPFDQHMLLALIAPRPLYVASASEDQWADPMGEFLSAKYASPIYELYHKKGLSITEFPEVNQAATNGFIGYHLREGKHDVTPYDWEQYMNFADRHFWKK